MFLPLTLTPLEDPNHDQGERIVVDGEGAHVGTISNTVLAEAAIGAINETERLRAAHLEIIELDHYPDATIARKALGLPVTDSIGQSVAEDK